ncbi:MAG: heterodisulfide reductase-related iron-sulfur binding cluster [Candidatus Helarchaeota archaeon]
MRYTIFSGCLVQTRFPEYEKSAYLILQRLGLEFRFINKFSCCGSQIIESIDENKLYLLNARNFALAEQQQVETIITLCGSCTYILKKSRLALQDSNLRTQFNQKLSKLGLSYHPSLQITHLAEFLNTPKMLQIFKNHIKRKIPLKLAIQQPCMLYRPKRISQLDGTNPSLIINLLKLCGAEIIPYKFQDQCCEGTMLAFKKSVGTPLVKARYTAINQLGIDLFVVGCPNCQLVYSIFPSVLHSEMSPSLFFPQILGLSLGYSFKEVGLERNIDSKIIKSILSSKKIL